MNSTYPASVVPQSRCRRGWRSRRGSTAVEFSLVAIPIFTLVFGIIEIGRALMAVQALEEAARCGCRAAVVRGASQGEVNLQVDQMMAAAGIATYTTKIHPSNFQDVPQWDPIKVTVKTKLKECSWIPIPEFLTGDYEATCILSREADPDE